MLVTYDIDALDRLDSPAVLAKSDSINLFALSPLVADHPTQNQPSDSPLGSVFLVERFWSF